MSATTLSPRESLRLDYAEPCGIQSGFGIVPDFAIWKLRKSISGNPAGSTISQSTLDAFLNNLHPTATETGSNDKLKEFVELRTWME